jgi:hypothetical protein
MRFDGVKFTQWTPPAGQSLPGKIPYWLLGGSDGRSFSTETRSAAWVCRRSPPNELAMWALFELFEAVP